MTRHFNRQLSNFSECLLMNSQASRSVYENLPQTALVTRQFWPLNIYVLLWSSNSYELEFGPQNKFLLILILTLHRKQWNNQNIKGVPKKIININWDSNSSNSLSERTYAKQRLQGSKHIIIQQIEEIWTLYISLKAEKKLRMKDGKVLKIKIKE